MQGEPQQGQLSGATERSLILLAADFPPSTGGIQTATWELYSRLAPEIRTVVAPGQPGAAAWDQRSPLKIQRLAGTLSIPGIARYWANALTQLLRSHPRKCVVHCNHLFVSPVGLWLKQLTGTPYVVFIHVEELTNCRFPRLARRLLQQSDGVIVNSHYTQAAVEQLIGAGRLPMLRVHFGASERWLRQPVVSPATWRQRLGVGQRPMLVTISRLTKAHSYKGVDTAIRALRRLHQAGVQAQLAVIGEGADRERLEGLAEGEGVSAAVRFLGRLPDNDAIEVVDAADLCLLLSREERTQRGVVAEGFGIAVLEANARGKAVVAGKSGGLTDAVEQGVNGVLVDSTDPDAVARVIAEVLSDPERRQRLGANGQRRLQSEYNWDFGARQLRTFHQEILSTRA